MCKRNLICFSSDLLLTLPEVSGYRLSTHTMVSKPDAKSTSPDTACAQWWYMLIWGLHSKVQDCCVCSRLWAIILEFSQLSRKQILLSCESKTWYPEDLGELVIPKAVEWVREGHLWCKGVDQRACFRVRWLWHGVSAPNLGNNCWRYAAVCGSRWQGGGCRGANWRCRIGVIKSGPIRSGRVRCMSRRSWAS